MEFSNAFSLEVNLWPVLCWLVTTELRALDEISGTCTVKGEALPDCGIHISIPVHERVITG